MTNSEPNKTILCGRHIGHNTGWDEGDNMQVLFYDFVPVNGMPLPTGDVWFDMASGKAALYKNDGSSEKESEVDFIPLLALLPSISN